MFFKEYLNERLKDKDFRNEYEAVERNEARKIITRIKTRAKRHSKNTAKSKISRVYRKTA